MGRRTFYINWLIIIPVIILTCLGLATLASIDSSIFYQQLLFVVVGVVAFFVFSRINFSIYPYLDKFLLIFMILFIILSYFGPSVRGATRWLMIGPFGLQPSELGKPLFLLAISSLLVRFPPIKIKHIALHTFIFLFTFLLVLRQPDLGSALVYGGMWVVMIILAGLPLRYILGGVLTFMILLPTFFQFLHGYQKQRILTFLNPLVDPQGTGYNAIQSMISVGSGQLFGRGFGRGTQSLLRFLPERHTDFIFASFGEAFGLIGGVVLLIIFFVFLGQILKEARLRDMQDVEYLFLAGFFMQLFTHVVINIGMNMGIVPITGITLPFVSYGGSSFLASCIGLGICMAAMQKRSSFS